MCCSIVQSPDVCADEEGRFPGQSGLLVFGMEEPKAPDIRICINSQRTIRKELHVIQPRTSTNPLFELHLEPSQILGSVRKDEVLGGNAGIGVEGTSIRASLVLTITVGIGQAKERVVRCGGEPNYQHGCC